MLHYDIPLLSKLYALVLFGLLNYIKMDELRPNDSKDIGLTVKTVLFKERSKTVAAKTKDHHADKSSNIK